MPRTEASRGPSTKSVLKIVWEYPTYNVEAPAKTGSVAKQARRALDSSAAYAYLAGKDPRPLLVLRECKTCNGTDDALLSKGVDNERTFLLSTWFHCVKLPVDVLEKDHPFHNLFDPEDAEHLFVALPDGSLKVRLQSDTSRTELWDAMGEVLAASYKKDPQPVVKLVQKSFDRLDVIDQRLLDLRAKKNGLLETEGAGSKKLAKVDHEIAEAKAEIDSILAEVRVAQKLELKVAAPAPADAKAGAPASAGAAR